LETSAGKSFYTLIIIVREEEVSSAREKIETHLKVRGPLVDSSEDAHRKQNSDKKK